VVTPTIAGGVAATALGEDDPPEGVLAVTVTAWDGVRLPPQADTAAAIATLSASATAADLYLPAGMTESPWGERSGTGFRAGNHAATNRNLVPILTARPQLRQEGTRHRDS